MCPAFSVQKGRVDEVIKRREGNQNNNHPRATEGGALAGVAQEAGGIRLPPGMKGRENL